jgi:hypothetical protein
MKKTLQRTISPLVIGAMLSVGCATSYAPQEPGRIHFLISSKGEDVLEKDGRTYNMGALSGDLLEAVSGSPAAEAHARTFVHRQRIAGGLAILALGALVPGYLLLAEGITGDPQSIDRRRTAIAGLSTILGSCAALMIAVTIGATSERHLYDAINIYNDDIARRQTGFPILQPGLPQPGAVPTGLLIHPQPAPKLSEGYQ